MSDSPSDLGDVYAAHQRHLWGLCYRMTGSASDADDIVQDTFTRALASPPADTSRPWRPWLVRVSMNLSRDVLRARQRAPYVGPWLPQLIDTSEWPEEERAYEPETTAGRYELLESVSLAFLVAIETLNANQRAVLLLCDVFQYTAAETAAALDLTPANTRQILRRARTAMAAYDKRRQPITNELKEQTRDVLSRFLAHMAMGDASEMEKLLADEVRVLNDGNGEFFAARKPVVGRARVARFHVKLVRDEMPALVLCELNGLPAFVGRYPDAGPGWAAFFANAATLDRAGKILDIHTIVARRKLEALSRLEW